MSKENVLRIWMTKADSTHYLWQQAHFDVGNHGANKGVVAFLLDNPGVRVLKYN